jgi:hypothetical protein
VIRNTATLIQKSRQFIAKEKNKMRDYLGLGSVPQGETCSQTADPNYFYKGQRECQAYVDQLLRMFGNPDGSCEIGIRECLYDEGNYFEVVVWFDDDDEEEREFAYDIEDNLPNEWDQEAKAFLGVQEKSKISERLSIRRRNAELLRRKREKCRVMNKPQIKLRLGDTLLILTKPKKIALVEHLGRKEIIVRLPQDKNRRLTVSRKEVCLLAEALASALRKGVRAPVSISLTGRSTIADLINVFGYEAKRFPSTIDSIISQLGKVGIELWVDHGELAKNHFFELRLKRRRALC